MSDGEGNPIESRSESVRIGFISGQSGRLNERAIDNQWIDYLGQYAELVPIPPFRIFKLFNGSIDRWLQSLPHSLDALSRELKKLCDSSRIRCLYLNLPAVIPFLLMARTYAGLDLGVLFLAHSVGSERWVRQWIAIAPWLTAKDVLLCSTASSREALLRISDRYRLARHIPLCIAMRGAAGEGKAGAQPEAAESKGAESRSAELKGAESRDAEPRGVELKDAESRDAEPRDAESRGLRSASATILSIGRIEDVKNIHLLLPCFAAIRAQAADARLVIAGEYTGSSAEQIDLYRQRLDRIVRELQLEDSVSFAGPVEGEAKAALFRRSALLLNLSTDPGETFGFNLIEAKVWGVPVVCSNWDGFQEVVGHGVDGFLAGCVWERELPLLRWEQAAEFALLLLQNEPLRAEFSQCAKEAARSYDYRRISPSIAAAVEAASTERVEPVPDAWEIARTEPIRLPRLYRVENLRQLPFGAQPLLAVAAGRSAEPVEEWMGKVKPLIGHFAGG